MPDAAIGQSKRPLLGEQTADSLIRNTWRVYRRHFGRVVLTFALPTFPLFVLATVPPEPWNLAFAYPFLAALFIASGALTIVVSDICLGNAPSVRRSFSQVLRRRTWLKLITAALLGSLLVYLGLVLLLVGAVWAFIRLIFSPVVVALERRSGRAAIRRSFQLTRGQFWRLFGLFALTFLLASLVAIILVVPVGVVALANEELSGLLVFLLLFAWYWPVLGIATVLLYYDQRVRREGYDADALSEDMMR